MRWRGACKGALIMKIQPTSSENRWLALAALSATVIMGLSSCATRTGTGAVAGAGTGALIAGPAGAAVGAGVGAVGGAVTDPHYGNRP